MFLKRNVYGLLKTSFGLKKIKDSVYNEKSVILLDTKSVSMLTSKMKLM